MSYVAQFASKYPKHAQKYEGPSLYFKIKATIKWIEYSLDITEMTKMLTVVTREEKYILLQAMQIAERKRDYMYKHPNFNMQEAIAQFKLAKRLLKL